MRKHRSDRARDMNDHDLVFRVCEELVNALLAVNRAEELPHAYAAEGYLRELKRRQRRGLGCVCEECGPWGQATR